MTRTILEFCREVLGIEPTAAQALLLNALSMCQLVVAACGRRSGKSLMAAIWASYDATMRDLSEYLRPAEVRYVVLVAASLPQARALFRTLKGLLGLQCWPPTSSLRLPMNSGSQTTSSLRSYRAVPGQPEDWPSARSYSRSWPISSIATGTSPVKLCTGPWGLL